MTRLFLSLALITVTTAASAQDLTCDPEGSQAQMNACALLDFKNADLLLTDAYKAAMNVAREGDFEDKLRDAQRLWIPYRDAACAAEAAQFQGGTIVPLIEYTCLATLTEERTHHLKSIQNY